MNQYNTTWPSKWPQYGGCGSVPGRTDPLSAPPPPVFPSRVNSPQPAAKKSTFLGMKTADLFRLSEDDPPPFKFQFPSKALCFAKCTFLFLSSIAQVWSLVSVCVYTWVNVRHLWVIKLSFQSRVLGSAEMFRSKSLSPKVASTDGSSWVYLTGLKLWNCVRFLDFFFWSQFFLKNGTHPAHMHFSRMSDSGLVHIFLVYLTYNFFWWVWMREEYKKSKQTQLKSKQWTLLKWPSVSANNGTVVLWGLRMRE